MVIQASTIRTEINKAGVLWDDHVKQIRYRARRLSSGRDHKGSKETRQLYKEIDALNQAY